MTCMNQPNFLPAFHRHHILHQNTLCVVADEFLLALSTRPQRNSSFVRMKRKKGIRETDSWIELADVGCVQCVNSRNRFITYSMVSVTTMGIVQIRGFQSVVRRPLVVRDLHSGDSRSKWDYKRQAIIKQNQQYRKTKISYLWNELIILSRVCSQ